ncbi:uncharacterized protein LOC143447198 isoform X1 [Clavelina lepadiformis]|uniref:uncharacterized protein LOC143447198 isoform X1 n=2 Tax=Clavelina lepadiformis TaxID=159417 RepID=UPI004042C874
MMPAGECVQYQAPQPLGREVVIGRLKRRADALKQRTQESEDRLRASQPVRAETERNTTAMLIQKVQEGRQKKGKYKSDVRSKSTEQTNDLRQDSSDLGLGRNMLKRRLEVNNGSLCNNGALVKPNNLLTGCDSAMTPSGGVPSYIGGQQQFDFLGDANGADNTAKKMKIDNDGQFIGNNSANNQTGAGNNNCNGNVSIQIVHQLPQRRIETTVNVNTSINSSKGIGKNGDTQSVSVDVGAKDIKQELGQDSTNQNNTFTTGSMAMGNSQNEQSCEDEGDGGFNDLLQNLLNEINNPDGNTASEFDLLQDNSTEQQTTSLGHEQQQSSNIADSSLLTEDQKNGSFQCKTEKVDFMGFVDETNPPEAQNSRTEHQQFYKSSNQTRMYKSQADGIMPQYGSDKPSSSFNTTNATNQANLQQNMNLNMQQNASVVNGNMTSQHVHRLNISVNSKFNTMQEQQQQHQQQQQQTHQPPTPGTQQQMGVSNMTRPTANPSDKIRHAPEGPPRLSHLPGPNKSASPSTVSYSVSHKPHPGIAYHNNGQPTGQFYPHQAQGHPQINSNNPGMTQNMMRRSPHVQLPNSSSQNYSPGYQMHRASAPGVVQGMKNPAMSGIQIPPSNMSKAQQLKELAERTDKRVPPGVSGQWSTSTSASVNMQSNMSFNGQSLSQQQHMSAEMQNYASFNSGPNPGGVDTSVPNMPQNNLSKANAAAQAALLASQRQQNAVYGARQSHYSVENYVSNQNQQAMTTKTMYGNPGMPNPQAQSRLMQRAPPQQMMRSVPTVADIPAPGSGSGMSGFYRRQVEPGFNQANMAGNSMMNTRVQQSATLTANQQKLAHRGKLMMEQYQINARQKAPSMMTPNGVPIQRGPSPLSRQAMMPSGQAHMTSHNLPPSVIQSRLPGSTNTGTVYQGSSRNPAAHPPNVPHSMNLPQAGTMQPWNRGSQLQSQAMSSNNKLPSYGMNPNSNPMPVGGQVNYQQMGGIPQRQSMGNMGVIGGAMPNNGQMQNPSAMMSQGHTGSNIHMTQHGSSNNMTSAGYPPQQQSMFSSTMGSNNGMSASNPNQSFNGVQGDMLGAFDGVFEQNNGSPNLELNIITDYLDGKYS